MRHAAITTQLLNRARDAANARAEAEEQLEHRPQAKARTQPKRPGAVGWVVALSRRVRALGQGPRDRHKEDPMQALVTGGTGVVGHHAVASLVGHGHQVPPRWLLTIQDWPRPSSRLGGLRRPPARSRAPPAPPWLHRPCKSAGDAADERALPPLICNKENHHVRLDGLVGAVQEYPGTHLELEIVEVDVVEGDELNVDDTATFKVRVTNSGALDVANLQLKIEGLNGVTVAQNTLGAPFQDSIVTLPLPTIRGHSDPVVTPGEPYKFKAPGTSLPDSNLLLVSVGNWSGLINHILNDHSDPNPFVRVFHRDEVLAK